MSQELTIKTVEKTVVMCHGGICVGMPWEAGIEFFEAITRLAKFSREYAQHKQHELIKTDKEVVCRGEMTIFRTGLEFLFLLDGHEWIRCPWTAAVQIAANVKDQAGKLEEIFNHERVTEDAAILLRTGLPIGLTNNPKILKQAWKDAEEISFPGMVEPTEIIHAPSITMSPPPGGKVEDSQ
jgi:hypothetical protein